MGTRHKGSAEEVLALDTFIKLSRASESFDAKLARAATLEDLTITQFAVLEALYHLGSLSQSELGAKLLKSGGNITLVIDNLQRHGYVERRRCDSDRRITYVNLTEEGRDKISRVFPNQVRQITRLMSVLGEEEQRELGRLLRKLGTGRDAAPASDSLCDAIHAPVDEHEAPAQATAVEPLAQVAIP